MISSLKKTNRKNGKLNEIHYSASHILTLDEKAVISIPCEPRMVCDNVLVVIPNRPGWWSANALAF